MRTQSVKTGPRGAMKQLNDLMENDKEYLCVYVKGPKKPCENDKYKSSSTPVKMKFEYLPEVCVEVSFTQHEFYCLSYFFTRI